MTRRCRNGRVKNVGYEHCVYPSISAIFRHGVLSGVYICIPGRAFTEVVTVTIVSGCFSFFREADCFTLDETGRYKLSSNKR